MRNHTTATLRPDENRKYTVIIPAAGMGIRMRTYGPKALIDIEGTPLLERQVRIARKYLPNPEIVVVGGFEYKKFIEICKRLSLNLVYNPLWETKNVVSSIRCGLAHSTHTNIVILYGDLIFNAYALKAPFCTQSVIIVNEKTMKKHEVGCNISQNTVQYFVYNQWPKWAHIAYITGHELELLRRELSTNKYDNFLFCEIMNNMIDKGAKFLPVNPMRSKIIDIDHSRDIKAAGEILR